MQVVSVTSTLEWHWSSGLLELTTGSVTAVGAPSDPGILREGTIRLKVPPLCPLGIALDQLLAVKRLSCDTRLSTMLANLADGVSRASRVDWRAVLGVLCLVESRRALDQGWSQPLSTVVLQSLLAEALTGLVEQFHAECPANGDDPILPESQGLQRLIYDYIPPDDATAIAAYYRSRLDMLRETVALMETFALEYCQPSDNLSSPP